MVFVLEICADDVFFGYLNIHYVKRVRNMKVGKLKVSFNSPVVLGFFFLSLGAYVLNLLLGGWANHIFFSVYRSSLLDPCTYIRFFGHVIGHANWDHFVGNMMMILVVGPILEEKYGSSNMLFVILATALVTGLVQFVLFPGIGLLGASGVVFMMILLSAFVNFKNGEIPVTLILVALFYIGGQIYDGLFLNDNVSQLTHIIGGFTGAGFGYVMNKNKMNRY